MQVVSKNISIIRDAKSPYWVAQFTSPDGVRRKKSTKVPVAGGLFEGVSLTRAQAKNRAIVVAHQLAEEVAADFQNHDNRTVREVCALMVEGKLGRVSLKTYKNAQTAYQLFLDWLGKRADEPIRHIRKADIKEWVLFRRSQVRAATCRKDLSLIRSAFVWAEDAEIIPKNPCDRVQIPVDSKDEKVLHEAFSPEEIRLLLQKLPECWATAVRCCLGTYGQRLGDVLALRWDQFDFAARTVLLVTGKTARPLCQPMQEWFYRWAVAEYERCRALGGEAAVWVCPELRRRSYASQEFTQLVRAHGIGLVGDVAGGRRRRWHSKTFHSLRASVATMLQSAGVSQGLAMQLVGHDSADVHAVYIRPSAEQLRQAAEALPDL